MVVAEAPAGGAQMQLHLRKIHRPRGRAGDEEVDQLARYLAADALLRLLSRTADMRGEDDIAEALHRALEAIGVRGRLDRKHVDGGAREVTVAHSSRQRIEIDDGAAAVVDQEGAGLHRPQLLLADHP